MDLENKGDTFVRRVVNHLPSDVATDLRRQESSSTKYSTGVTEVKQPNKKNKIKQAFEKRLSLKRNVP
jgi:hypothetical protein